MLHELHIRNLAVIEELEIKLGSGLTILSGEEGAGKSLITDAISVLLGSRAQTGLIRTGATSARVEGVFFLSGRALDQVSTILAESAIEPEADGMLIISREIQEQGRSVARVNGRVVPLSQLRLLSQHLVDLHSQGEHLALLGPRYQLELLDVFGELTKLKARFIALTRNLTELGRELSSTGTMDVERQQELLKYQAEEIEAAGIQPDEDEILRNERERLCQAEALKEGCLRAYGNLYGEERSATVMIHQAIVVMRGLANIDKKLSPYGEKLEETTACLEEAARELRAYGEGMDVEATRLEQLERRIELLAGLKRKYGPGLRDILVFGKRAVEELEALEGTQQQRTRLEKEKETVEAEAGKLAEELSLSRRRVAASLAALVNEEISDLGLPFARFDISLGRQEDALGLPIANGKRFAFTAEGIDRVVFQIATNPGEPMRPLADIASGGETCRIMLALKSALERADPVPTIIFDEIDMGMGGRNADVVGKKLANLARHHQVLCITHLPQIACFGDAHLHLLKEANIGRATAKVELVEGQRRVQEIAAMLGSKGNGRIMRDGAGQLLEGARAWKDKNGVAVKP